MHTYILSTYPLHTKTVAGVGKERRTFRVLLLVANPTKILYQVFYAVVHTACGLLNRDNTQNKKENALAALPSSPDWSSR